MAAVGIDCVTFKPLHMTSLDLIATPHAGLISEEIGTQ